MSSPDRIDERTLYTRLCVVQRAQLRYDPWSDGGWVAETAVEWRETSPVGSRLVSVENVPMRLRRKNLVSAASKARHAHRAVH